MRTYKHVTHDDREHEFEGIVFVYIHYISYKSLAVFQKRKYVLISREQYKMTHTCKSTCKFEWAIVLDDQKLEVLIGLVSFDWLSSCIKVQGI